MSYADSAIDFGASIEHANLDQGLISVKYYPVSSGDSDRPAVYRNISLTATQMSDSVAIRAAIVGRSKDVVSQWDAILESRAANPSFSDSDLLGEVYLDRFIPKFEDSAPTGINTFKYKLAAYDSETNDYVRTHYSVVAMGVDSALDYANTFGVTSRKTLMTNLVANGRLDSVDAFLGLFDDSNTLREVKFRETLQFQYADSLMDELRVNLGYNDSDWLNTFFSDNPETLAQMYL